MRVSMCVSVCAKEEAEEGGECPPTSLEPTFSAPSRTLCPSLNPASHLLNRLPELERGLLVRGDVNLVLGHELLCKVVKQQLVDVAPAAVAVPRVRADDQAGLLQQNDRDLCAHGKGWRLGE